MVLAIIEGIVLCFVLLLVCVVNIRNGAVGGVHYYEPAVQRRVVALVLITEAQIRRNRRRSGLAFMAALLILAPLMAFGVNGARGFGEGFVQLLTMYMVCNAFDRLFIDAYWVGRTRAWIIPGTEDLRPYIHRESWIKKLVGSALLYPLAAALLAWAGAALVR